MKRSSPWVAAVCVACFAACLDSPTEPSVLLAIQGTAHRGGTPVPAAKVALWDVRGDPAFTPPTLVATTTADAQGRYYLGSRVRTCANLQLKADIDDPSVWSLSLPSGQIVCTEATQNIDIELRDIVAAPPR